jgi:hypothetical protein
MALIICFAGLAAFAAVFGLRDLIFPRYEKLTDKLLEIESEAFVSYSVHLNDNPVFDDAALPEGGYYIKPFIDYVDITCRLSANADQAADIDAVTAVDVTLVSQLGNDEDAQVIWEKTKTYAPEETVSSSEGAIDAERAIKLDFAQYDTLISELIEQYDLVTDYYIKVRFYATVHAQYEGETVEEPLSAEIIIPLNNQIFSIDGDSSEEIDMAITRESERKRKFDVNDMIPYAAGSIACILIVLLIIFKTKPLPKQDEYTVETARIFKKYNNRLAGLSEALTYQASIMISIDKIEDMVKIADEIGQTIFYFKVEDEAERKIEFYIFDESRIFYLAMFGEL